MRNPDFRLCTRIIHISLELGKLDSSLIVVPFAKMCSFQHMMNGGEKKVKGGKTCDSKYDKLRCEVQQTKEERTKYPSRHSIIDDTEGTMCNESC